MASQNDRSCWTFLSDDEDEEDDEAEVEGESAEDIEIARDPLGWSKFQFISEGELLFALHLL